VAAPLDDAAPVEDRIWSAAAIVDSRWAMRRPSARPGPRPALLDQGLVSESRWEVASSRTTTAGASGGGERWTAAASRLRTGGKPRRRPPCRSRREGGDHVVDPAAGRRPRSPRRWPRGRRRQVGGHRIVEEVRVLAHHTDGTGHALERQVTQSRPSIRTTPDVTVVEAGNEGRQRRLPAPDGPTGPPSCRLGRERHAPQHRFGRIVAVLPRALALSDRSTRSPPTVAEHTSSTSSRARRCPCAGPGRSAPSRRGGRVVPLPVGGDRVDRVAEGEGTRSTATIRPNRCCGACPFSASGHDGGPGRPVRRRKTTLSSLIPRLLRRDIGSGAIDGRDVRTCRSRA